MHIISSNRAKCQTTNREKDNFDGVFKYSAVITCQNPSNESTPAIRAAPAAPDSASTHFAGLPGGPHGFLVKDSAHAELIDAIRSVAAGKPTFSPAIERQLKAAGPEVDLTPRQIDILKYVANGLSNKEIAPLIGVGPDCVKAHLKAAFARLGATSRSEAVAIAIRLRLLEG